MLKSSPPGLQNVTAFGDMVLKAVIRVKGSHVGRTKPYVTSVLIRRGDRHTDTLRAMTRGAHKAEAAISTPAARPQKAPALLG